MTSLNGPDEPTSTQAPKAKPSAAAAMRPPKGLPVRKVAAWTAGAIGAFVVLAAVSITALSKWAIAKYETEIFASDEEERLADAVIKDLERVAQSAVFRPAMERAREGGGDAGAFFNARLAWFAENPLAEVPTTRPSNLAEPLPAKASRQLALPRAVEVLLADWGENWDAHARDLDVFEIDVGWFRELAAFTYWDLERSGPFAHFLAQNPHADAMKWPRPDLQILLQWSKLRLLHGLYQSAPEPAFREVEQLAKLLLSTENLVGVTTGIEALALINKAHGRFVKNSGDVTKDFRSYDPSLLERAMAASWGISQYVDWRLDAKLVARVLPLDKKRPFACAALAERLETQQIVRALLSDDYPERFAHLESVVERIAGQCRLAATLAQWRNKERIPEILSGDLLAKQTFAPDDSSESQKLEEGAAAPKNAPPLAPAEASGRVTLDDVKRIPFARQLMGLLLAQFGPSSYLQAYLPPAGAESSREP